MAVTTTTQNVETVKGIYESFAEGDIEAIAATWAPNIEFIMPEGLAVGGIYHGRDEIIENVFMLMREELEEVSVVPDQFVDGGNTVVALMTWGGTFTGTGRSIEYPEAHVFDFDDGKITRWTSYADTALWNAAFEA